MESRRFNQLSEFLRVVEMTTKKYKKSLAEYLDYSEYKISHVQATILILLSGSQGKSQLQISNDLNKDPAAVSRMINLLQKQSLLLKKRQGKEQKIYLTPEGVDLVQNIKPQYKKHMLDYFSSIHDKEINIIKEIMLRLDNK